MDTDQIKIRIDEIKRIASDDEMAHAREDDLYLDFVRHVAESGPPDLADLARLVLTTHEIEFERWCA